jgi:pimeloyl-ACP methyl ester carboxylesterase
MATYVALHGFASSPRSKKNEHFVTRLAARGITLTTPDLNQPSFAKLSFEAMVAEVERSWRALGERPMRMIGSSLGGYVAALFASRHPERVERLVLLCPAFDLVGRWRELITPEKLAAWERDGTLAFDDATGTPVPVHYAFFLEGQRMPAFPRVACPAVIVHGTRDETVPFAQSVRYAKETPAVHELVEVDDGHDLLASLPTIDAVIDRFLIDATIDSEPRKESR